jgi:hypothetical protein
LENDSIGKCNIGVPPPTDGRATSPGSASRGASSSHCDLSDIADFAFEYAFEAKPSSTGSVLEQQLRDVSHYFPSAPWSNFSQCRNQRISNLKTFASLYGYTLVPKLDVLAGVNSHPTQVKSASPLPDSGELPIVSTDSIKSVEATPSDCPSDEVSGIQCWDDTQDEQEIVFYESTTTDSDVMAKCWNTLEVPSSTHNPVLSHSMVNPDITPILSPDSPSALDITTLPLDLWTVKLRDI